MKFELHKQCPVCGSQKLSVDPRRSHAQTEDTYSNFVHTIFYGKYLIILITVLIK